MEEGALEIVTHPAQRLGNFHVEGMHALGYSGSWAKEKDQDVLAPV